MFDLIVALMSGTLQADYKVGYQEIKPLAPQAALLQPSPQQQGSSASDSAKDRQTSIPSGMVRTDQPARPALMRLQPVPLQLSSTNLEYHGGDVYRIARVRCTPISVTIETSSRSKSPVAQVRCAEPYSLAPVRPATSGEPFFTLDTVTPGLTETPDCERFAGYRDWASVPAQVRAICYQARTIEMTNFVSIAREAMASGQPLHLLDGWHAERGAGAEVTFRAFQMSSP